MPYRFGARPNSQSNGQEQGNVTATRAPSSGRESFTKPKRHPTSGSALRARVADTLPCSPPLA